MSLEATLPLPEWALVNAVRYALGRHSYVTGDTADLVRAQWRHLSSYARDIIRRDVREHVERIPLLHHDDPLTQPDNAVWRSLLDDLPVIVETESGALTFHARSDGGS